MQKSVTECNDKIENTHGAFQRRWYMQPKVALYVTVQTFHEFAAHYHPQNHYVPDFFLLNDQFSWMHHFAFFQTEILYTAFLNVQSL